MRDFEECKKCELGCMCGHVEDRRRDACDLTGYNYDRSQSSYLDCTDWSTQRHYLYEGSDPALAIVGSKLVTVDLYIFFGRGEMHDAP